MRIVVATCLLMLAASTAGAAVLCAPLKRDGTFNSAVKVREACRRKEVQLGIVGLDQVIIEPQSSTTTSTMTTSTSTTTITLLPTCTTVGADCGSGAPGTCACVALCEHGCGLGCAAVTATSCTGDAQCPAGHPFCASFTCAGISGCFVNPTNAMTFCAQACPTP